MSWNNGYADRWPVTTPQEASGSAPSTAPSTPEKAPAIPPLREHTDTMNDFVLLGLDRDEWKERAEKAEAALAALTVPTGGAVCRACEGSGSVATERKDEDGFPVEEACPLCSFPARGLEK